MERTTRSASLPVCAVHLRLLPAMNVTVDDLRAARVCVCAARVCVRPGTIFKVHDHT